MFLVHDVLPDSIASVALVPVIEDEAAELTSMDNYRPIALCKYSSGKKYCLQGLKALFSTLNQTTFELNVARL